MNQCECRKLKQEGEFSDPKEFEGLLKALKEQKFKKLKPKAPRARSGEEWYECPKCSQVWSLCYPDLPSYGYWEPVEGKGRFR